MVPRNCDCGGRCGGHPSGVARHPAILEEGPGPAVGRFGMTVALVVVWLIVSGVCFFFFFFPSSVWPARI